MSVRKDKVQIEVEINGKKATGTYKELQASARQLNLELKQLTPGTEAFRQKAAQLKSVNDRLAKIRKDTRGVATEMDKARMSGGRFGKILGSLKSLLGPVAIVAGIAAIGRALVRTGAEALKLFNVQAKADAQLKATLRSTNEAAGRSLEQLKEQAAELQKVTLFGDEQTQQAQALLLTFTNVRTEVFDKSIPLIQDYATALATASGGQVNLKDGAIQIGKALNDPIKGVTALSRAGVQFTDQQKEQIKVLQESGDLVGAQTIVLAELEKQFAGSARAAAEAGLGPYTQLGNRVDDLKESFGLLIERGLRGLIPVANLVIGFVEKLAASVVSGEAATGQFAEGVNGVIVVFKALSLPIRVATQLLSFFFQDVVKPFGGFVNTTIVPAVQGWIEKIIDVVNAARRLPVIGTVINGIIGYVNLFKDALDNTSATFAGLRAAAGAAIDNIKTFLDGMVLSAQIAAKKLDRALSIKQSTKDRLSREIQELETLKAAAAASGQSIGEAYATARDEAIRVATEKQAADEAEQERLKAAGLENVRDQLLEESVQKAVEREKLKNAKVKAALAQERVAAPQAIGTTEIRPVSSTGEGAEGDLDNAEKIKLERLKNDFLNALIAEQEYEEMRLQLQADYAQRRLELLIENGMASTQTILEAKNDALEKEKAVNDQRIENEQRLADFEQGTAEQKRQLLDTSLDALTSFLGADAAARKKNAGVIKAFEIGKIITNAFAEISNIFKNFSTIPFIGQALAVAKATLVTARSNAAINKIKGQKFARGGRTGSGIAPPDETGERPVGLAMFHEHEWTAPRWMTQHPRFGKAIDYLENVRVRGFADGGFTTVDTTPRGEFFSDSSNLGVPSQGGGDMNRMEGLLEVLIAKQDNPRPAIVKREDLLDADEEDVFTAAKAGF